MTQDPFAQSAKITLIRPPVIEMTSNLSTFGAIPPIGLAYVAAVLRDAGHQITVVDAPGEAIGKYRRQDSPMGAIILNGLSLSEIVDRISIDTQIIGITNMFLHEWPTIRTLLQMVRLKLPDAKIILGGENATAFWSSIFEQSPEVDFSVLGEGEATMLELVSRLTRHQEPTGIPGVMSRSDLNSTALHRNPVSLTSPRATELSEIPWPAWELFPINNYLEQRDRHGVNRGRSIPLLATRGCPYQCSFCSSPTMWTTKYKTREPEDVVKEICFYVDHYQADNFNLCDLTAIVNKNWILKFCQLLIEKNLNITWQLPSGTRSEALDREVLILLYQSGCRNISYAAENGSKRMLEIFKKRVNPEKIKASMRQAFKVGIVTRIAIIIGHPDEHRLDILKTLFFIMHCAILGANDCAPMIFSPYPGSEDARKLIDQGKLKITEKFYYYSLCRSGTSRETFNRVMGSRELKFYQFFLLVSFYLTAYLIRPHRIYNFLMSFFTHNENTLLDQLVRTKVDKYLSRAKAQKVA